MPAASSSPSPGGFNPDSEPDDHMDLESNASQGEIFQNQSIDDPQIVCAVIEGSDLGERAHCEQNSDTLRDSPENFSGPKKRKRSVQSDTSDSRHTGHGPLQASQTTSLVDDPIHDPGGSGKRRRTSTFDPEDQETQSPMLHSSVHGDHELYGLNFTLWKRIFCFVPPVFLGRLLRVSRSFHALLTSHSSESADSSQGLEDGVSSESIWTSSRKRFAPGLPKPLRGQGDLEMWRLLRGQHCQNCRQSKIFMTTSSDQDPWENGPGNDGVRVIWPFRIRSCGPCLESQCEQEISLLCSSSIPSFLLQALPCIFLTQERHVLAPTNLVLGKSPTDLQVTKYFYKPHLQEIESRFNKVKELGSGSVEEWIKGLDGERKESLQDAARWEQWEVKGGLKKVNSRPSARAPTVQRQVTGTRSGDIANWEMTSSREQSTMLRSLEQDGKAPIAIESQRFPQTSTTSPISLPYYSYDHVPGANSIQATQSTIRQGRNIIEANEAKALRRADIERRCLSLDPSIPPNVLIHMESFQAALQISTPLTERAWEILKPRLLSQVIEARSRDAALAERLRVDSTQVAEQGRGAVPREEKHPDPSDREWELSQVPVQEYLSSCADVLIVDHWGSEAAINSESAPKFAADILLATRAKFNEETSRNNGFASEASSNQSHSWHHKLTLENMKWLYDQKIKSVAERFQKELFLCNGCEANSRYYGFEAVIQHYAAKHTSSLSLGNVVVNWRSEWPEEPPFHPNPPTNRSTSYPSSNHWKSNSGFQIGSSGEMAVPSPMPTQQMGFQPQNSVVGGLNHHPSYAIPPQNIALGDHLAPQNQPLEGTKAYESQSAHPYSVGQNFYAQQLPHYSGQSLNHNASYGPSVVAPQLAATNFTSTIGDMPMTNRVNNYAMPFITPDLYQTQLNDMAKHARDVWFGMSGIKDISQSVRIFVVIHHVVSRFEQKYTNEPNLSMFIDGLNHCPSMRPVRSLNGLACKTCVNFPPIGTDSRETKLYTLPHLLNHFQTVHLEKAMHATEVQTDIVSSRLDWKVDMIELPKDDSITNLVNASGIDDKKLGLIASVFPKLFPRPLPKLSSGNVPKSLQKATKRIPNLESFGKAVTPTLPPQEDRLDVSTTATDFTEFSPRASEAPGEDEYDPHRPAYLGHIIESHQLNRSERSHDVSFRAQQYGSDNRENGLQIPDGAARSARTGAFSEKLLRHHGRASGNDGAHRSSLSHMSSTQGSAHVSAIDRANRPGFASQSKMYSNTERSGLAAADKFLDELDSGIETGHRVRDVDYRQSDRSMKVLACASDSIHSERNNFSIAHNNLSRTIQSADHRLTARYTQNNDSHASNGGASAGRYLHDDVYTSRFAHPTDNHFSQGRSSRRFVENSDGPLETRNNFEVAEHVSAVTRRESNDFASFSAFGDRSPSLQTGRNIVYYERSKPDTRYSSSHLQDGISSGRMEYVYSSVDHPSFYPNTIREQRIEYVPLEPRQAHALPYIRTASPAPGKAVAHSYYDRSSQAERFSTSEDRLYYRAGETAWTPVRNYGHVEEHV